MAGSKGRREIQIGDVRVNLRWATDSQELALSIARRFVEARRTHTALAGFPGPLPQDMAGAYACQEAAIALWPDDIVGWKVARIAPELRARLGTERLAGPVFRRSVRRAAGHAIVEFPVFENGFAAVEAEFIVSLGADAPAHKLDWTIAEAAGIAAEMHIGVETAGSPLATINELGPTAIAADFGNNSGVILGPAVRGWRERAFAAPLTVTCIEDRVAGRGQPGAPAGAALESLRFLLEHCARRGRPLRAGHLITTGALTGVHDICAGQSASIDFGPHGVIHCRAVALVTAES
jgi:2-keto-4-pentenoate hydratase